MAKWHLGRRKCREAPLLEAPGPRHLLRPKRRLAMAWNRRQAMGTPSNRERPVTGNAWERPVTGAAAMRMGTPSSRSLSEINHEIAQARWGIHPTLANNTVECTTQKVFRISCPHPSLTKRIRKNNRILCYNRLPCNVFADTMISGTVTKRVKEIRKCL